MAESLNALADIGAVTLASEVGSRTGTFDLRVQPDEVLRNATVTVAGYPGDKSEATMWQASGQMIHVDAQQLYFQIDVTHGNSGGPIWMREGDRHNVVGVVSHVPELQTRIPTQLRVHRGRTGSHTTLSLA